MTAIKGLERKASQVAEFVKGLASPHRLMILCHLTEGERSVSDLITLTGLAQTSMSQHLSRLKNEGIVTFRRDHRTLYYRISNDTALKVMDILYNDFCKED